MKKITAIVLCVLLAMSALVVLAACGTKEYVVSFREQTSKIIYQGKTINGKAVEPKAPAKEGYEFKGWYKTLTGSADDNGNTVYTFSDPMDFDKAVDGDLDLYAKYELSDKPAASANPYYLVGSFSTDSWNGNGVADLNRLFVPDADGIPTAKITAVPGLEFKVKYAAPGWHDDLDVAYGALKGVTLDSGVELPDGIEDANDLFASANGEASGNIKLSDAVADANLQLRISLTYIEATKSLNIKVLEISDYPVQANPNGYRVVGNINGKDVWNTNDAGYKLIVDEDDSSLYSISITLLANEGFKVKKNDFETNGSANWNGDWGFAALESVTAPEVSLPTSITTAAELFTNDSGNIKATVGCSITLTLNIATNKLSIVVTEIAE